MCREEAQGLSSLRPQLDERGVPLHAVVHQTLGVDDFRPFFQGDIFLDTQKTFYGPKQRWMPLLGVLRFTAMKNAYRAMQKKVPGNLEGEGRLLGGVFVLGPGDTGILFQHHEKEFGDHANLTEVLEAVRKIPLLDKKNS